MMQSPKAMRNKFFENCRIILKKIDIAKKYD